ncbi:MAG: bacteriophage holin [Nitrospirota bacterium]|nr:MAG: bacteriophage holin [Nitrospirota bacterium]
MALGIGLGAVWGVSIFITTWVSYYTGYADLFLRTMAGSIYPGYSISPVGSFVGAIYSFIDGIVGGYILAWIYNKVIDRR